MSTNAHITSKDVLKWAINNSIKMIKNGGTFKKVITVNLAESNRIKHEFA